MEMFDFGNGPVAAYKSTEGGWIASTATIGEWATVGERATVGEWATVGERATVGDRATVGEGATVGSIKRSDGYTFTYIPVDNVLNVFAGCRSFPMPVAREHWKKTRGGTKLGDETMAILDYLEAVAKIYGCA